MDEYSQSLIEATERVVPTWINRLVFSRIESTDEVRIATDQAAVDAQRFVRSSLTNLFDTDIDSQASTPLAVMREATKFAMQILASAGAPPVARDEQARRLFPEDDYDLVPANWGDIDESLVDPALAWGAAKAMAHRARHEAAK